MDIKYMALNDPSEEYQLFIDDFSIKTSHKIFAVITDEKL